MNWLLAYLLLFGIIILAIKLGFKERKKGDRFIFRKKGTDLFLAK